jgi:hypothetical protein
LLFSNGTIPAVYAFVAIKMIFDACNVSLEVMMGHWSDGRPVAARTGKFVFKFMPCSIKGEKADSKELNGTSRD